LKKLTLSELIARSGVPASTIHRYRRKGLIPPPERVAPTVGGQEPGPRAARTLHFSSNHQIDFDGEHAHLTARLMAIHVHPGENPPDPLIAANLLDTDAVSTSNGWRFERFAPRTLWRSGQSPSAEVHER
jgi:hypothetical protein